MRFHPTLFLIAAVAVVALTRLLPHPPNFSPLVAMALFSGAVFSDRFLALAVTLGSMLVADLILGFHNTMIFVYAAMALIVVGGSYLRDRRGVPALVAAGVAGSVAFFVISNAGVWLLGELYPITWSGFVACYVAAVPFFHYTLWSTLFYAAVLFAAEQLMARRSSLLVH